MSLVLEGYTTITIKDISETIICTHMVYFHRPGHKWWFISKMLTNNIYQTDITRGKQGLMTILLVASSSHNYQIIIYDHVALVPCFVQ